MRAITPFDCPSGRDKRIWRPDSRGVSAFEASFDDKPTFDEDERGGKLPRFLFAVGNCCEARKISGFPRRELDAA